MSTDIVAKFRTEYSEQEAINFYRAELALEMRFWKERPVNLPNGRVGSFHAILWAPEIDPVVAPNLVARANIGMGHYVRFDPYRINAEIEPVAEKDRT